MRKDYNSRPFTYDSAYYECEYEKAIVDCRLRAVERSTSMWRFPSFLNKSQSRSADTTRPADPQKPSTGPGGGRIMSSFRKGNTGDPSSAVCLICARRGHFFSDCTYTTFEDGPPVVACTREGLLVTIKGNTQFCRNWNIKGDNRDNPCSHTEARAHKCTFCGDKGHHAFTWSCRKKT